MRLTGLFNISILCVIVFGYQNNEEKVLLVAPVLAPNKNPRARVIETAKDFPIVRLLSIDNSTKVSESHKGTAQPIYVEKLEDQENTRRRKTGPI
ncbi:cuticular protein glycine-rich 10 precursor [Danaus plexippus plexippus]|uniref:Cuticular protein glycine-rich 10 n=1 Tax=Danaus plexippus plexippus TaxID=278856 RepID=A0A212EL24_DANPL|nr:cuticular protein glycine-rich 10 precursor [Danaus plexippus plexippus]